MTPLRSISPTNAPDPQASRYRYMLKYKKERELIEQVDNLGLPSSFELPTAEERYGERLPTAIEGDETQDTLTYLRRSRAWIRRVDVGSLLCSPGYSFG